MYLGLNLVVFRLDRPLGIGPSILRLTGRLSGRVAPIACTQSLRDMVALLHWRRGDNNVLQTNSKGKEPLEKIGARGSVDMRLNQWYYHGRKD